MLDWCCWYLLTRSTHRFDSSSSDRLLRLFTLNARYDWDFVGNCRSKGWRCRKFGIRHGICVNVHDFPPIISWRWTVILRCIGNDEQMSKVYSVSFILAAKIASIMAPSPKIVRNAVILSSSLLHNRVLLARLSQHRPY